MGLYDTIRWACPACGQPKDIQTKAGTCNLETYHLAHGLPRSIAHEADGEYTCEACDCRYVIGPPSENLIAVDIKRL